MRLSRIARGHGLNSFTPGLRIPGPLMLAVIILHSSDSLAVVDKVEGMPTPGLYQVDNDSHTKAWTPRAKARTVDIKTHGSSGRMDATWTGADGKSVVKTFSSEHGQNICVPPRASDGSFVVPDSPGCEKPVTTKTASGWLMKMKCSFGDFTTNVKQLDKKTWEYTVITSYRESPSTAALAPGTDRARSAHEKVAKNALTTEEGAQAQVANKKLIPKVDFITKETKAVLRWTKIAESCLVARK